MAKRKAHDEAAEFVMSFIDSSEEERRLFEPIWEEVEQSFLVRPISDLSAHSTQYPLDQRSSYKSDFAVLKDPETHQVVMTIVSKIVLASMGEPGYIKTRGVGSEDVLGSENVSKLLEYSFRQEGELWTNLLWVLSAAIYGTGIVDDAWYYEEGPREFRSITADPFTGQEISDVQTLIVPTFDDPRACLIDVRDFYPDTSETMLCRMLGAAKRLKMVEADLIRGVEEGRFKKDEVEKAMVRMAEEAAVRAMKSGDVTAGQHEKQAHPKFKEQELFEYYGRVPYESEDGIDHRVVTVLNGTTIRDDPWPRRIPFFECKLTPRLGSFWGISPGEVMRYDQDFTDTLKMMIADGVVRSTHPPHMYNRNAGVDVAKLRAFRSRVPIAVDGSPDANISQVVYNPPLQSAFSMYGMVKGNMREGSGALGAIQGLGLGSKRFSATEAAGTFEQAFDRPEMWSTVFDREFLPPRGKYRLDLYRRFLEENSDDLQRRIGQSGYPIPLSSIMSEYDLEFIGSKVTGSRSEQINAFREINAAGANPIAAQIMPWIPFFRKWFDSIGAPEIAAMVGNPQLMQLNMLLHQIGGPNPAAGNGNGEQPSTPPSGLLPAQIAGRAQ